MISSLSGRDVQKFIASNEQADVQKLLLKHKEILGIPTAWVAQQIQGRRKVKDKLPAWYNTPGIIYPPAVNLEQCSSQVTAMYKHRLVGGHHAADLTGGFGVDAFYLSQVFSIVDYVEPDQDLLNVAKHNHTLLGALNIKYHNMTAEDFLGKSNMAFDLFYADPSRRSGTKKIIRLEQSIPDVIALKSILLKKAQHVLIKSSPLLDLKHAYRELKRVDQFIVLAVENECKELLIGLRHEAPAEPTIHAVDLDKEGEPTPFAFTWSQEKHSRAHYSLPLSYLYEPNAAILKAGAFKLIGESFRLLKLAPDTHLYTSDEKIPEFPGRLFKVVERVTLDKKLKEKFNKGYVNILTRNYPLSVEKIKKKTGLEEGGTRYLICARSEKPMVLVADRLR